MDRIGGDSVRDAAEGVEAATKATDQRFAALVGRRAEFPDAKARALARAIDAGLTGVAVAIEAAVGVAKITVCLVGRNRVTADPDHDDRVRLGAGPVANAYLFARVGGLTVTQGGEQAPARAARARRREPAMVSERARVSKRTASISETSCASVLTPASSVRQSMARPSRRGILKTMEIAVESG